MKMSTRYDPKAPRRHREAAGLDMKVAALKAGIALQTLRYLERGMSVPRANTLARLASAYGVDVGTFFSRKDTAA
jgi:transcriptional regulator with XRE-family HTH domain